MIPLVLTPETVRAAEAFDDAFHLARMEAAARAWPEAGIEVRRVGGLTAVLVAEPSLRSKNRILSFGPTTADRLDEALALYCERGLPTHFRLPRNGWSAELFDALVAAGLRSAGSGATPAALPQALPTSADVFVRDSPPEEERTYMAIYRRAFGTRGLVTEAQARFQWIEDSLPGSRRFVAEVGGEPAGVASMVVLSGTAYLAMCGVLPEFRGRGVHRALIEARLGAAHAAGCALALGGGDLFSPPRRNFERCGFAPIPLGMSWSYVPPAITAAPLSRP